MKKQLLLLSAIISLSNLYAANPDKKKVVTVSLLGGGNYSGKVISGGCAYGSRITYDSSGNLVVENASKKPTIRDMTSEERAEQERQRVEQERQYTAQKHRFMEEQKRCEAEQEKRKNKKDREEQETGIFAIVQEGESPEEAAARFNGSMKNMVVGVDSIVYLAVNLRTGNTRKIFFGDKEKLDPAEILNDFWTIKDCELVEKEQRKAELGL